MSILLDKIPVQCTWSVDEVVKAQRRVPPPASPSPDPALGTGSAVAGVSTHHAHRGEGSHC